MFENIGGKIKTLAVVTTIIGMILSIVVAITLGEMGILIGILGCLFSWIGSFVLYGFGEIIVSVQVIAANTKKEDDAVSSQEKKQKPQIDSANNYLAKYNTSPQTTSKKTTCPYCLETVDETDVACKSCGNKLNNH